MVAAKKQTQSQIKWIHIKSTLSTSNTIFQIAKKTNIPADDIVTILNQNINQLNSEKFNNREYFILKGKKHNSAKIVFNEAFNYLKFD